MRKISIPKEKAVFWLDKNGRWHNEHGAFQHKKVIAYFHSSIRKDDEGYHVFQSTNEFEEKVYFNYEDTALFVFHVIVADEITLVLNTKKRVRLRPDTLVIRGDNLYVEIDGDPVKFTSNSLVSISHLLDIDDDVAAITINNERFEIPRD